MNSNCFSVTKDEVLEGIRTCKKYGGKKTVIYVGYNETSRYIPLLTKNPEEAPKVQGICLLEAQVSEVVSADGKLSYLLLANSANNKTMLVKISDVAGWILPESSKSPLLLEEGSRMDDKDTLNYKSALFLFEDGASLTVKYHSGMVVRVSAVGERIIRTVLRQANPQTRVINRLSDAFFNEPARHVQLPKSVKKNDAGQNGWTPDRLRRDFSVGASPQA